MALTEDQLRLTVILPTYGRPESLRRCLEGLAAGTRLPEETLVVGHASDPEAGALEGVVAPWAQRLGARLVWAERAGQIHQMNCGLAAATGEVVCFTDDDCVPRPPWLARLAAGYADPTVSGVGGRDVVHHGDGIGGDQIDGGRARVVGQITWYGRVIGNHHLELPPGVREVEQLKGANMSFRRALTPPLEEKMVLGLGSGSLNDTELSLAVRERGGRLVYDPEALVDHYPARRHGATHRDMAHPEQVFLDAHNWAYCLCKHFRGARRVVFLGYALGVGCGNRLGVVKYLATVGREPRQATLQLVTTWKGLRAGMRDWRQK
jgi:glycosyltransferase involved in cell wall biosynthesis